ncbi:MAG: hypothetical protein U5L72_09435 [Bacteroidales bacterium]|nr:hypothetical protein [Bacteroidales bacterium]
MIREALTLSPTGSPRSIRLQGEISSPSRQKKGDRKEHYHDRGAHEKYPSWSFLTGNNRTASPMPQASDPLHLRLPGRGKVNRRYSPFPEQGLDAYPGTVA